MSRRFSHRVHGSALEAPSEDGFIPGDAANPGLATKNRPRARTNPGAASSPMAGRVWAALKLASGMLIVVIASTAVAWGAHRYALTTPRFAVRRFEVEGARRLGDDQIAKRSGMELGRNIFAIDTEQAERQLLVDPWVREVKITRQLPATLRVELVERDVAAVAAIGEGLYLVTKGGEPFKRLENGDPYDLPVITGISAEALARDRQRELERIIVALEVLRTYDRLPLSRVHVAQEVNLGEAGDVSLSIGKLAITLQLGNGPWRKKLLMAASVMAELGGKGRVPGIVFLDNQAHPERVVVRMR